MDAPLEFSVEEHGDQYIATRGKGRAMREDLEDQIARGHHDGVLINFTGVEAMTISFADEFLGRFYASLAAGDVPAQAVLLLGLNEENLATVSICLERRDLAAAAIIDGQHVLLGAAGYLTETYRHAMNRGTFSALDLSTDLKISPQNMNNRLKRLVMAGAIQRRRIASDRGGKEFVYTVPSPLPRPAPCGHAL